eukprot:4682846-Prymnesium_polylepis.1
MGLSSRELHLALRGIGRLARLRRGPVPALAPDRARQELQDAPRDRLRRDRLPVLGWCHLR